MRQANGPTAPRAMCKTAPSSFSPEVSAFTSRDIAQRMLPRPPLVMVRRVIFSSYPSRNLHMDVILC